MGEMKDIMITIPLEEYSRLKKMEGRVETLNSLFKNDAIYPNEKNICSILGLEVKEKDA